MSNLKKLKVLILGLMLIMVLGSARAQITDIHIYGKRHGGVEGDVVRVPVIVDTEGFGQEGIIAFRLDMSFSSNMKYKGTSIENSAISTWNAQTNQLTSTSISFNAAGISPIQQDSAVLFYIDFELLEVPYNTQGYYYISGTKNYFNEGSYNITMPSGYGYVDIINKDQLSAYANNSLLAKGDSTIIYISGGTSPYSLSSSDENVAIITSGKYLKGLSTGNVIVNVTDAGGLTGKTSNIEIRGFRLSLGTDESVIYPGSTFIAQINTTDLTGMGIISGKVDFTISGGAVLTGINANGAMLENYSLESKNLGSNNYRVSFAGTTPLSGNGALINLEFEVPLNVTSTTIYASVIPQMNENQIGIFDQKTIYFTPLPNLNISALSAVPNPIYPGTEIGFQVTSQTGIINWSLTNPSVGTIDENGLFKAERSGQTYIKVTDDLGATSQYGPITIKDGSLEVASQVAVYNSEHLLPIRISALPADRALYAFDMKLNIDTSRISFVEVVKTGALAENFSIISNNTDPRNIRIVGAGQQSIMTAGDLFYFKIQLKEKFTTNNTYIYVSNALFNEGLPDLQLINGTVTPGNPPPVAADNLLTIAEDEVYSFKSADFPYSQVQNTTFEYVKIISLPTAGTLTYNGGNASVNQVIPVSSLPYLNYKGPKDLSGNALDSFVFKVGDNASFSNNDGVITFDITPVNDSPVFELDAAKITLDEDFIDPVLLSVINVSVPAQEDGETYTYSLSPASVTFAALQFDAATGQVTINSVANGFGSQVFTITADDGQSVNNQSSKTFELVINNVNDAPVTSDASFTLDENSASNSVVGTVSGSDVDGDALSYSISAGNEAGAFAIGANTGVITVAASGPLDFETTPVFTLTVSVSDGNLSATSIATISLNDVFEAPNQAPVINDQSFAVVENAINGLSIGTVVASDPESDPITFSITAGANGAFIINSTSGLITVSNQSLLDFETTPVFTLTVSVSDGELSSSATVTINLTDVDESVNQAPQITDQSLQIDENSANGTVVGSVFAGDPDGNPLTYTIISGSDAFNLNSSTGQLTVANSSQLDYESVLFFTLIIEVSDGALTNAATITINLLDVQEAVNEAPVITDQSFTIAELSGVGTVVGQVLASDPNGSALTYSISAGDNMAFSINASTGELIVASQSLLDFETTPVFVLTIAVSDGELWSTATITVNLTDVDESVNQAPTVANQTFSIAENSENGTVVGTVVASDVNLDALTYSIVSGGNGAFAVNATSGELTVANLNLLDFETTPQFVLTVSVSDGVLSTTATITINLTDVSEPVNQAPVISDQSFTIAENSFNDMLVGSIIAADPDGNPLTYSITSGGNGAFNLNGTNGSLTVADQSLLDFETTPTFTLTVSVSDGSLSASATITVHLTDVVENQNQAPVITNQTFTIAENSAAGTQVGIVTATDPENNSLFFSITNGNSFNTFVIDNSGKLSILSNAQLDFERNPTFTLTVQVSDGQLSSSATITVKLTDVNEVVLGNEPIVVKCFPNPVINELTIQGMNISDVKQFRLVDQTGKLVFTEFSPKTLKVDFSAFPAGVYFLQIVQQKETLQFRIVK